MNKLIFVPILSLCLLCFCPKSEARENISVAFVNFRDNSSFQQLNTDDALSEILLERLFDFPSFSIYERVISDDSLELENRISLTEEKVNMAVKSKDFNAIFKGSNNRADLKKKGEYLPAEHTKKLGAKYQAEYLIFGTIDYIEGNRKHNSTIWNNMAFTHSSKGVEISATIKIIRAEDGKIIWSKSAKGTSKNRFNDLGKVAIGSTGSSDHLFYDALEEIGDSIVRLLRDELAKQILKL